MRKRYPTDVSDAEWAILEPFVDRPGSRGPARTVDLREVWNAAMYVLGEGCRWRSLPHEFPPHGTVCYYFHRWRRDGTLEGANDALRRRVRLAEGRSEEPSLAILDSQSVKAEKGGRGYDGGKRLKGRKRFLAVDALGLVLSVRVVGASVGEPTGGKALLRDLAGGPRLSRALVDGGYGHGPGSPLARLGRELGVEVEVVESLKGSGFRLQARRWVVERTFAWLVKCRRLRTDYELEARTTAAWVHAAMVRLMARRLAKAT